MRMGKIKYTLQKNNKDNCKIEHTHTTLERNDEF